MTTPHTKNRVSTFQIIFGRHAGIEERDFNASARLF